MNLHSYPKFLSFLQTFGAIFVIELGFAIGQLDVEQIISGEAFASASITALIFGVGRSAFKAAWERILPEKLGGIKN